VNTVNILLDQVSANLTSARNSIHTKEFQHAETFLGTAQGRVWQAQSRLNCLSSQGMKEAVKSSQNRIDSIRAILDKIITDQVSDGKK